MAIILHFALLLRSAAAVYNRGIADRKLSRITQSPKVKTEQSWRVEQATRSIRKATSLGCPTARNPTATGVTLEGNDQLECSEAASRVGLHGGADGASSREIGREALATLVGS